TTCPGGTCQSGTCTPNSMWNNADIGTTGQPGTFVQSGTTYTVGGSGADIWSTADNFHYAFQQVAGDSTITAHLASVTNTNSWAKTGVMMRDGTTAGAINVFAFATPNAANFYRLQTRVTTAGTTNSASAGSGAVPTWL